MAVAPVVAQVLKAALGLLGDWQSGSLPKTSRQLEFKPANRRDDVAERIVVLAANQRGSSLQKALVSPEGHPQGSAPDA